MRRIRTPLLIKNPPLLGALTLALAVASAQASEPVESGAGRICGTLKNFQGEIQVFDSSRTHLGEASFGTKLRCGDWISVDQGKAVIEHFTGAALAVSDRSFIQILDPQSGENPDHAQFTLYRGEMMVSAPKAKSDSTGGNGETRVMTPNAIIHVVSGAAYALYSTNADETQAIGLGGKVSLENRFFQEQRVSAGFAQFVSFSDPAERLVPEQARYVNPRDLNERLAKLGIPASIRDAVEKSVKAGAKARMPVSLASAPRVARPESQSEFHAAQRGLASVPERKPASTKSKPVVRRVVASDEPDFRLKRQVSDDQEKKRLLQALSSIRADEE